MRWTGEVASAWRVSFVARREKRTSIVALMDSRAPKRFRTTLNGGPAPEQPTIVRVTDDRRLETQSDAALCDALMGRMLRTWSAEAAERGEPPPPVALPKPITPPPPPPAVAAPAAPAGPDPRSYRGVSANKDRWQARIKCGGYQEYIGTFDDKRDAARAYDARVRALGLDARLNFPDEHGPAPPRIKPRAPRREALARARRKADAKADAADAAALLSIRAAAAPW